MEMEVLACEQQGDVYWFGSHGHMNVEAGGQLFREYIRFSGVLDPADNGLLKARQLHVSYPQGAYEDGKHWFSEKGLSDQIEIWLHKYDVSTDFVSESQRNKVMGYLEKAKQLIDDPSIDQIS
jgi:hypothetical protein